MEIDSAHLWMFSYFRASELAGALLMGRLARRVADPEVMAYCTEQCAEEARHAWLWTQAIISLGATPLQIKETHQSMYVRLAGYPKDLLDIFAFTKVFEERAYRHFEEELERGPIHPKILEVINTLQDDERNHLASVDRILDKLSSSAGKEAVDERIRHYQEIDERAYELVRRYREKPWDLVHLTD